LHPVDSGSGQELIGRQYEGYLRSAVSTESDDGHVDAPDRTDVPFNYPHVGALVRDEHPPGYEHFSYRAVLGGPDHFPVAAEDLLSWRMHQRSGIRVTASAPTAARGTVLVQRFRIGPVVLVAPVRVIDVLAEVDRVGLVYGTLRGHPEQGEERFVVERGPGGQVTLTINGFVRPAAWYARLGAPVTRLVQRKITRRYLRALGGMSPCSVGGEKRGAPALADYRQADAGAENEACRCS
jgi:uncharacterized protein (UPF0548 family)